MNSVEGFARRLTLMSQENHKSETGAVQRESENPYFTFARYVLVASLVVAAVAFVLYFIWFAADFLLLIFAGILVSILLRGVGRTLRRMTGISRNLSIGIVVFVFVILLVAVGWLVTGRIGTQITEFQLILPQAVERVKSLLGQYQWVQQASANMPDVSEWLATRSGTLMSGVTGMASTVFGVFLDSLVVFVIGLYLAFQPTLYTRGIKLLLPFGSRERAGEVLHKLDEALWHWLGGRFLLMIVNGVLTGLGLWLLGVPLALTLGLLCGLLNFIPTFGPWIAAVPAILIAFLQSPQQALYAALLFLVLQSLDGYVFTPLVDRKSVEMPPVLTISAILLLGFAFGFLGLLLASPLAATLMILVRMLYVGDVLGKAPKDDGGGQTGAEDGLESNRRMQQA